MTFFAQELKKNSFFWNNLNLNENLAVPQVQENGDYFIGFCTHREETHDGKIYKISDPKYGMLFRPKANGHDSLYIGPCNEKGQPHTDPSTKLLGLSFLDLDFSDQPLSNNYKSFYMGEFTNGLFDNRGELLIVKNEDYTIKMPLIMTQNSPFSKIHFLKNTSFLDGKLGHHCDLVLIHNDSKMQDPSFKSIKSYTGNIFDGVFHGKGELKFTNGDSYEGMFKFGRKEGKGIYKSKATGDEYDSEWDEDLIHGKCRVKFGADQQNDFVNLGDFDSGWNEIVEKNVQKKVLPSFLVSEYYYAPKITENVEPAKSIEVEDFGFKFNVEAMVKKLFRTKIRFKVRKIRLSTKMTTASM